jgi:very-short-patch-repair endonuclease
MSKQAEMIKLLLQKKFPNFMIITEYYVNYQNEKLLFDFLIKELGILIEVQGEQHFSFNNFFYKDGFDFYRQKKRDALKREWASMNGYTLVTFDYDEKLNEDVFMVKIKEAFNG